MPKRILQGTVTSAKNDKTVSVKVERTFRHPYIKTVRKSAKYAAHDAKGKCKVGDKEFRNVDRCPRLNLDGDRRLSH